jgi:hypothetical protein
MRTQAIWLADRLLAGGSPMGETLRLLETGIDGPARVIDVLDIRPLGGLGETAKLGLTLAEAKQILARLRQAVVAVQADDHAVLRPECFSCGHACHVKDTKITETWSNGQTEGQINRLKMLKRAMYGRAGIDLLHARTIPLNPSHTN